MVGIRASHLMSQVQACQLCNAVEVANHTVLYLSVAPFVDFTSLPNRIRDLLSAVARIKFRQ